MRARNLGFAVAGALLAGPGTAWCSPWLPNAGDGEMDMSIIATQADVGLDGIIGAQSWRKLAADVHFEYGVTDGVTLLFDSEIEKLALDGATIGASSLRLGKAMAGVRVSLARWENTVLSAEASGGEASVNDGPQPFLMAAHGEAPARLLLGRGFPFMGCHSFASLEAGWRWRAGPPANEVTLDTTLGGEPWKGIMLLVQTFSTASVGAARAPYQRYELSKLQLSVAEELATGVWLQTGVFGTFTSDKAGREKGLVLSLWWKF